MTDVFPNIVERYPNYASIFFRNEPQVAAYEVRVAATIDDAYGAANGVAGAGSILLFNVAQGGVFSSRSIRRKGLGPGSIEESNRGQTRAMFDLDDLRTTLGNPAIPPDAHIAFLRVRTRTVGTTAFTTEPEGPILIMQNPNRFTVPRPALTFGGTAPNLGALAGLGLQPTEGALEFRVPAFGDSFMITNHGTTPLFVSTGRGIPYMQIDNAGGGSTWASVSHTSGMSDSLLIAANGGNPLFSVMVATVAGIR